MELNVNKPTTSWAQLLNVTNEEFLDSNTYRFAIKQMDSTYVNIEEGMQQHILQNVIDLLQVLYSQGHSGASMSYALAVFTRLANFKPLVDPDADR